MRLFLAICLLQSVFSLPQTPSSITTEGKNPVYDVVIVGAGLTGLSAARRIAELSPNASVLLLESRGQVGGRIRARSLTTAKGDEWVDLGSQFIGRDQSALLELARKTGTVLTPQSVCGQRSLLIEGTRRKREVSWSSSLSIRPSLQDLLISPDAKILASQSVGQFARNSNLSAADAATINRLLQTLFDAPENMVSTLQIAMTAASEIKSVSELLAENGHGQSMIAVGGMYQMVRSLADGLHIEYDQKVIGVNQASSPAIVMTEKSSYRARNVLVALPPIVASGLVYSPPIDTEFSQFLKQYRPTGNAYYFTMTFNTAFWRGNGKNGQIIYTNDNGPLVWMTTFDLTSDTRCSSLPTGISGILWGIAHFSGTVDEQQRTQEYIKVVRKSLDAPFDPLDVKDVQFSSDPSAMGSIGVLPPGINLDSLKYLTGVAAQGEEVFFASAELSNASTGLMNGAVLAGQSAADAIISKLNLPVTSFDAQSILFDAPLQEINKNQPFVYSTSTHYPPTPNIHIILAPAVLHEASRNNQFDYQTSTHYPPLMTSQSVQRDSPNGNSFVYSTSTQYPSTPSIETTTYKHFSFGNADGSAKHVSDNTVEDVAVEGAAAQNNFVYNTSTHYPPTEPIVITTFSHFSFGNEKKEEDEEDDLMGPAQMIATPPPSQEKPMTESSFVYSTSTPYPSISQFSTTTMKHFSFGNVQIVPQGTNVNVQNRPAEVNPSQPLRDVPPTVPGTILKELQEIVDTAPSTSQLSLATKLSAVVQRLLGSITGSRR